jgi:hypothetical protein
MIYVKTVLGQSALQNRALGLTPRQRSAFIMFDGKRAFDDVMKATAGLGFTPDDLSHLVSLGLLEPQAATSATPALAPVSSAPVVPVTAAPTAPQSAILAFNANGQPTATAQARYSKAYPIATRLTAALGLRGFRLNLAVEAAGDLDKLKELAPKIREAVGPEKFLELENALYY